MHARFVLILLIWERNVFTKSHHKIWGFSWEPSCVFMTQWFHQGLLATVWWRKNLFVLNESICVRNAFILYYKIKMIPLRHLGYLYQRRSDGIHAKESLVHFHFPRIYTLLHNFVKNYYSIWLKKRNIFVYLSCAYEIDMNMNTNIKFVSSRGWCIEKIKRWTILNGKSSFHDIFRQSWKSKHVRVFYITPLPSPPPKSALEANLCTVIMTIWILPPCILHALKVLHSVKPFKQ